MAPTNYLCQPTIRISWVPEYWRTHCTNPHPLLPVAIAHIHNLHAIHTAFTSKDQGKVLITTRHLPYERWLKDWTSQFMEPAYRLRIPAAATRINSPLVTDNWRTMLADYPNKPLINFFILVCRRDFVLASHRVQLRSNQPSRIFSVQ